MNDPIRVMIVDDSAVIRGLFTRFLEADPAISVVASVSNGQMAVDALGRHDVEIIVLDIEMPVMDGLTALPLLLEKKPGVQILMASTLTRKNADISLRALSMGATDYVAKPSSTSEIHSADAFKHELTGKIKAISAARRRGVRRAPGSVGARPASLARSAPAASPSAVASPFSLRRRPVGRPELIAIGSSTGGPQALFNLFGGLSGKVQQPILITQHMPATFTALLAGHIARASLMPCAEAADGDAILPGRIYVAPGDNHMLTEPGPGGNVLRLSKSEPENYCRPSVDPMLRTLAALYGPKLLVIILTGMGADGRKGAEAVVAAGGTVIAQDEESSVVWGMPGAVATAGFCSAVLPLCDIASYVHKLVVRSAA